MFKIIREEKRSLVEVAYMWLNSKKDIKLQTRQKYERTIVSSIEKWYKDILISKLTKDDVIDLFDKLKENNLSLSFQKTVLYIIKASVNYAYSKGYCDYIDLKEIKLKSTIQKIYVFSKEEQAKMEKECKRHMNVRKLCLLLCLYTGLRIGEVCGLKWSDINFSACCLTVNRTIERIKNPNKTGTKTVLIESSPKSDTSNRVIPLPTFLIDYLRQFKDNDNYFILSKSEKLHDPRLYEAFYKRLLKRCDITTNKFHSVRHLFATRAIESKMDIKTLSEILGHSSVEITLKLYVHPSDEMKRSSIDNLVKFMAIS